MKNMYIKYILSGLIVLGCNVSMADEVYRHLCSKADANNGVPGFTIVAGPLDLTFTDKELVVPAPLDTKLQLISKNQLGNTNIYQGKDSDGRQVIITVESPRDPANAVITVDARTPDDQEAIFFFSSRNCCL
jgi:hypothetical protein